MKTYLLLSTLLGFIAVAAGAFGAHALKERLSEGMLNAFEVGVRYQMYHVFAIMASVWLNSSLAAFLFVAGILLFSGSLYLYSLLSIKAFAYITPIGGLFLLAGWLALTFQIYTESISKLGF